MTGPGDALVPALRAVPLLAPLTDGDVEALAARGEQLRLPAGAHIAEEGDEQAWFHLLLGGRVEWTRRVNGTDVHVLTHGAGMYFGHEPILLGIPVPVTGTAVEPCWAFRLEERAFWDLLAGDQRVRAELITAVTQRFAVMENASQRQAKLASLGTLAAGLAHELNNPAAAVRSAVPALAAAFDHVSAAALRLARHAQGRDALDALEQVQRRAADAAAAPDPGAGSLERADAEDAVADWLADRGVDRGWDLAPALLRAGLDPAQLDALADRLPAAALPDAVAWLASASTGAQLLDEVRDGTGRISALVTAMREYTYLDRGERQQVDVHAGLESTLTILAHKLRGRIEVVRDYATDLPPIPARGSELNQVWTNLVDNAADAMADGGRLTITTRREGDRMVVDIADDGPGVPAELQERVFDPYFTTKGVGKGTGLGLDVARRIVVDTYRGDVRLTSRPGETHLAVRLPLAGSAPAPPAPDGGEPPEALGPGGAGA